jgi:hypothetical protein
MNRVMLKSSRVHVLLTLSITVRVVMRDGAILMMVVTALSPQASIRYLQPVSILTLFSIAISVDWLAGRRRSTALPPAS